MYTLTMIVTALAVVAFFVTLLLFVHRIAGVLEAIGGTPTSALAKLRLGLRAIETETGHLPGAVTALNAELGTIAGGLTTVDGHLGGTIDAAVKQERG